MFHKRNYHKLCTGGTHNNLKLDKDNEMEFFQGYKYLGVIFDDTLVNCNWVATRWQQYSTHLHTNSTQNDTKQTMHRTTQKFLEECGPCPVFASYTLAFALQLRKTHGKASVRVVEK
jgi:hypothetical protein